MQLKPIAVIAVLLLVVASLSVSGCVVITPSTSSLKASPTPSPTAATPTQTSSPDYSSGLTTLFESGRDGNNFNMIQPFGKSINERGNVVYTGLGINAGGQSVTIVVEFIKSDAVAKSVFNLQVNTTEKEGYTLSADRTTDRNAECIDCGGAWVGTNGNNVLSCDWENLWQFDTYAVVTQSWVQP
jgi:hypothetical protein